VRDRDAEEPDGPDDPRSGAPTDHVGDDALGDLGPVPDHLPDDLLRDHSADSDDTVDPPRVPLPPDDRLWRHPSELATAGLPGAAAPKAKGPGRSTERRAHRPPPEITMGQRLVAVGLAGGVGALLTAGTLVATGRLSRVESITTMPTATSTIADGPVSGFDAARVAARVQPGVLSVSATRPGGSSTRGSATIVQQGYAITALRIVDGASSLTLRVGGEPRAAHLVGSDPETDLALISIDGGVVEPLSMGRSAALRPGDTAVSVMAPPTNTASHSVTVGVVSALDRATMAGKTMVRGALQLDRPVPAEGAGGALADRSGNVIGITLPAADAAAPFGYAIPIDAVAEVARQLLLSGHVARPWLGIEGGDDDAGIGASVWQVKPSSPAARAGVQVGDIVLAMDDTPIGTMDAMIRLLRTHHPGDTIHLQIRRKTQDLDLPVTLAEK
jgi:putative serine protease PepD